MKQDDHEEEEDEDADGKEERYNFHPMHESHNAAARR